jgi:plastocyanin
VPFRLLLSLALACTVGLAHAAGEPEFALTIRDHKFAPAEVRIPANTKVKLVVDNQDATPEEFDSHALNREKVVAGKSKATIFIGPLTPGRYPFMGEFHADTAQGVVVAQ